MAPTNLKDKFKNAEKLAQTPASSEVSKVSRSSNDEPIIDKIKEIGKISTLYDKEKGSKRMTREQASKLRQANLSLASKESERE